MLQGVQAVASYVITGLRALGKQLGPMLCRLFTEPVYFPSGRRVTPGKLLAEGGFSFVYIGTESGTGGQVALKKIICQDEDTKIAAKTEAAMHERFTHNNLLPIVDKAFQKHHGNPRWEICWFVFPLCSCSLRDEITRRVLLDPATGQPPLGQPYSPGQVLAAMRGVCSGLQQMHRQSVSHRDVKPENVLLQRDGLDANSLGTPMLMDFGSCGDLEVTVRNRRDALNETETAARLCTMQYRAPELFDVPTDIGVLSYAGADVWSIGCTLYCCLLGYSPFEVEFDQRAPCRPYQVDCGHLRVLGGIPWPKDGPRSNVPEPVKDLIRWILTVDTKMRPDIIRVLDHMNKSPSGVDGEGMSV